MSKQLHSKNHYVPECYLKRWQNDDKEVFVYRLLVQHGKVPKWKAHSTSSIGYQKHLYTQIVSGKESDDIEVWFDTTFEAPANNAIEKALAETRLTASDWTSLINFLALQDVRTPARYQEHLSRSEESLSDTLNSVLDELRSSPRKVHQPKSYEANLDTNRDLPLKITTLPLNQDEALLQAETYAGRSSWLFSIRHLLNNTSKILHKHKWTIIKPAKGYFWPTSDNPVVKLNYYQKGNYDLKGGWDVNKGNIFFPLGPEHAMFVQMGERPIKKNLRVSEELTKQLRAYICENAHRKIFSHFEDDSIPRIRKRHINSEQVSLEIKALKEWHEKNSELEKEYMPSNKSLKS